MSCNFDDPLDVDILIAAMQMDKTQASELLETLAYKFEQALPENTEVSYSGGLFSKKKVATLTLRFSDVHFQISREKNGTLIGKELKVVRGVVLKTSEIGLDECIKRVAEQLANLAEKNSKARQTLQQFLLG